MKKLTNRRPIYCGILCLLLAFTTAVAIENKTVIGPTNPDLQEGANALLSGDIEEGIRLTLIGLKMETGTRDRQTAMSNLCAGYTILNKLEEALRYCNLVLEENDEHWRALNNRAIIYVKQRRFAEAEKDIDKGQELAPNSRTLKLVRAMLLDATNPVSPNIIIDDRRSPPDNDE
ncbi:MAG: tetratricopeptide repeat protein [Gammaproteobacteria bacterium]|nr:tetratricopeptide repeat protein [Gammaproteobacteria bacterium]